MFNFLLFLLAASSCLVAEEPLYSELVFEPAPLKMLVGTLRVLDFKNSMLPLVDQASVRDHFFATSGVIPSGLPALKKDWFLGHCVHDAGYAAESVEIGKPQRYEFFNREERRIAFLDDLGACKKEDFSISSVSFGISFLVSAHEDAYKVNFTLASPTGPDGAMEDVCSQSYLINEGSTIILYFYSNDLGPVPVVFASLFRADDRTSLGAIAEDLEDLRSGRDKGRLFIIAGPSGAGKTSVSDEALKEFPCAKKIISYTTRAPRDGEVNGQDYHFVSNLEFEDLKKNGKFLSTVSYSGCAYATPMEIRSCLETGVDCFLVATIESGLALKEKFPSSKIIFMKTDSDSEAIERIKDRVDESTLAKRKAINDKNLEFFKSNQELFDHVIVNKDFNDAVKSFSFFVKSFKRRG